MGNEESSRVVRHQYPHQQPAMHQYPQAQQYPQVQQYPQYPQNGQYQQTPQNQAFQRQPTIMVMPGQNNVYQPPPYQQPQPQQQVPASQPVPRVPSARVASARERNLYPSLTNPASFNSTGFTLDDQTLNRFIEIQSLIDTFEKKGVFDGLRMAEEEFEALEKSKRQAEINQKVLTEQTKKEKQDFENISQPTVQAYFRSQQAHKQAISKEEVGKKNLLCF